jgi:hypothetical protein
MKNIIKTKNNKIISSIYFHNNFHNGDVHLSRNFVRNYVKLLNAENYFYIHNCDPKITFDLDPEVKTISDYAKTNSLQEKLLHVDENKLFINTWIGTENKKFLKKFGLNYNCYRQIFFEVLKNFEIDFLDHNEEDLIPKIDFSKYNIEIKNSNIFDKIENNVLFCNNDFKSGQSLIFNMDFFLEKKSKEFSNLNFIVTNPTNVKNHNIFNLKDFIQTTGSDLIECAYISQFCRYIVGRSSGPYTFSIMKENLLDSNKNFICLSFREEYTCWYEKHLCKKKWFDKIKDFENINFME